MASANVQPLIMLGMNEINFDFVRHYARAGKLPHLDGMIRAHGLEETVSEQNYEQLEPWIQWVSIQTGMTFAQHQVFRLGDMVKSDARQFWEILEERGFDVAAVSPMNAVNRLKESTLFIPDAWTETRASGDPRAARLAAAISHVVNRNAEQRMQAGHVTTLLWELLRLGGPREWRALFMAAMPGARRWRLAMMLDRLLALEFLEVWRTRRPDFATLFLNAGAHIQHHYMFASEAYSGEAKNPDWYLKPGYDPILEVLKLYDSILGDVLARAPGARTVVATGLHQDPHPRVTYYWRLKDHAAFLDAVGVRYRRVLPRMSRDFLVECDSVEQARQVRDRLDACRADDGDALFESEQRDASVFSSLVYEKDIKPGATFSHPTGVIANARALVGFVAIKNGRHNGIGYVIDSNRRAGEPGSSSVSALFQRVLGHFGVAGNGSSLENAAVAAVV